MRKSLLLTALFMLVALFGVKAQAWQYELTSADGLPGKNMGMYWQMTTPVYELDEPTQAIRVTVFSTSNVDKHSSGYVNYGPAFPTFTMAELRLFDGEGKEVELTADMFSTNAFSLNEGSFDALVDDVPTTHFHSTYTKGEAPQAYHYIEIALNEPMSKFSLQWDTRFYYYYPDPTHVGITGGTEALPYKSENFSLGAQVTSVDAIQPNTLYAIRGNYFEYTDEGRLRTKPVYGEAFFNTYHCSSLTPSSASIIYFEPAAEGALNLYWLKDGRYLTIGTVDGAADAGRSYYVTNAAPLSFTACDSVEGAFEIKSNGSVLANSQLGRFRWVNEGKSDDAQARNFAWNIYEINVDNVATMPLLEKAIAKAENLMKTQGIASADEGEFEALETAVATAKSTVSEASVTANSVLQECAALNNLISEYRATYIWVLVDSIQAIIDEGTFCGGEEAYAIGGFPIAYKEVLEALLDEATAVGDDLANTTVVENMISKMTTKLDELYASVVTNVTNFPIHLEETKDALTAEDKRSGNRFNFTSPTYYLSEATDVIRFTWFRNTSMELKEGVGNVPFISLAEIYLYDEVGNKIELTEDMISSNSCQSNDGGGLAALCNGDEGDYYHGCWDAGAEGSYCPQNGEYAYLEIALESEITAFSYKFIGRDHSSDFYKHYPTEYAITPGTLIDYDEVKIVPVDEYKAVRGEQITDAAQIQPGELYILWSNLEVLDAEGNVVGEGNGYYNGTYQSYGKDVNSACVVTFEDAGEGKMYMRNISANNYLKTPAGWEGASVTCYANEAAPLSIMSSTNIANSFKIYYEGTVTDPEEEAYGQEQIFVMQGWASKIGMYTISSWENDDKDGESDWFIYKATVENPEKLNLSGAISTFSAFGIDYSMVGEAVGMLKIADVEPIADAVAKAEAALGSGDEAACKTAADGLRALISTVPNIKTNELISGQNYVIRSANKEFKEYHGDKKMAIFVNPANGSGAQPDANMLYFNYEYTLDGQDSTIFHFTFVQDTIYNEGEETWAKYTIKNVLYDEYIMPEGTNGKNLTTAKFSSSDAAPLIYLRPRATGQFALVGVDAWHGGAKPNQAYFETRTGGGPYGTSGKAHYGRVATWSYSANTAQWQIIPVATETSINNLVIDEPAGEVVSETYYTADGVATNGPVKGVCIRKRIYANGVIETKKVFIK